MSFVADTQVFCYVVISERRLSDKPINKIYANYKGSTKSHIGKKSVKSHHFSNNNSSNLDVVLNRNYNQAFTKAHQARFYEIFDGI